MTDTITLSRAMLEQALKALASYCNTGEIDGADDLLASLLAERDLRPQVEQEPVAWMCTETKVLYDHDTSDEDRYHGFKPTIPLYTAPPARKPDDTALLRQALEALHWLTTSDEMEEPPFNATIAAMRERLGETK